MPILSWQQNKLFLENLENEDTKEKLIEKAKVRVNLNLDLLSKYSKSERQNILKEEKSQIKLT